MVKMRPGTGGERFTPYGERTGDKSVVYFTRDLSAEGLLKIYQKVKAPLTGRVAVKLHTGEKNGPNIIPRPWVKELLAKELPEADRAVFERTADARDLYVLGYDVIEERRGGSDWRTTPAMV